jgi:membrane peptidoglycan carboxypeptidase
MADAPISAPPARLPHGRTASVVGGRLVMMVAVILAVALVGSVAALPLVVPAGNLAQTTVRNLGNVPPLMEALPDPAQRSVVYASDGKTPLAHLVKDENRLVVKLKDVPKRVRDAVVAIEDDRFYQHHGVDFRGILRAAVANLRSGRVSQGGSTLSQQLIKNIVTGNSRTIDRKLREAMYAVELERRMTKDQILERYLNQAYFGEGVYGIATAARHYFNNKSVRFLTLSEAASLAATISSPENNKPTQRKANVRRRNLVLDRMLALGFAKPKDVAKAKREKLKVKRFKQPNVQPYFVRYITDQLLHDPSYNDVLGKPGSDARVNKVFQGGLKIYTTLNRARQRQAAQAVQGRLDRFTHPPFKGDPAGALASVDPTSGRIVALYGGRDFDESQVDLATSQGGSGFQPGSAFKMFFVVAALEKGISPGDVMTAPARITIPDRRCEGPQGQWSVGNAGESSAGIYNMYEATARSVNTWFAQLAVKVGPENAVEVARRMGISNIPPRGSDGYANWTICSLVLGAREVSVLDMASAFGVLANKGVRCAPYSIVKVVAPNRSKPLIENKPECKQVVNQKISAQTVAMLRGVITSGTGRRAALPGRPLAGKTGSAQDYTSAFFSGFTPQLSTSVWVGYRKTRVSMSNLYNGGPVFGGTYPAEIFQAYMSAALAGAPVIHFPAAPPPPPPARTRVPNVVGQNVDRAQSLLGQAGLRATVTEVPNSAPKGRVLAQNPPAGASVPGGTTVTLLVSSGQGGGGGNIGLPNVVGLPVGAARNILTALGFRVGIGYTSGGPPNRVVSQSPGAGTQLPRGSYVTLVVGRGGR